MARNKAFEPEERLEKAKCLFWQKGYNATSMQDLVDTMGLNRGSIYDTYGDKHSLFLQCLRSYTEAMFEDYRKVAEETKSPIKAIEKIIKKAAIRTVEEERTCMGVKSTFELGSVDEEVHALLKQNTSDLTALLKDLLKRLRKRRRSVVKEIRQCLQASSYRILPASGRLSSCMVMGNWCSSKPNF